MNKIQVNNIKTNLINHKISKINFNNKINNNNLKFQ